MMITPNALASTPLSMPLRTSAGIAMLASASRPSRISPMVSATANGFSSLRSVKCGSGERAQVWFTSGTSLAGGSASTLASNSGLGGTSAMMLPRPPPARRP